MNRAARTAGGTFRLLIVEIRRSREDFAPKDANTVLRTERGDIG
jgi:hypothetical protein